MHVVSSFFFPIVIHTNIECIWRGSLYRSGEFIKLELKLYCIVVVQEKDAWKKGKASFLQGRKGVMEIR